MTKEFKKLKFKYQRNIDGSFFNQEYEYFTFDIGLTDDKELIDKYNDIIKDSNFHVNAQKTGLNIKTILNPDGKLSFINLRTKLNLLKLLIMSDNTLEIKIKDILSKTNKNSDINIDEDDILTQLYLQSPQDFQEIFVSQITKILSFGIPPQSILMAKIENVFVDTSDGTIFNINDLVERVKNGDFSDFDPSEFLPDDGSGRIELNFSDLIRGLAKKGHYIENEISILIILNKFIEPSKETCIEYITKLTKVEETISDCIIKNATISLGLEKSRINLEGVLNTIQENLYNGQMKSDPIIQFVPDDEALRTIDLVIQSDECVMKKELKDVVDSIGFSYVNKQLAVGSTLFIKGLYIPNGINKRNPFESIDVSNFSKHGYYYIILERHPGNGQVLRKVFNGKYFEIAKNVSDFIIKNESILLKTV